MVGTSFERNFRSLSWRVECFTPPRHLYQNHHFDGVSVEISSFEKFGASVALVGSSDRGGNLLSY